MRSRASRALLRQPQGRSPSWGCLSARIRQLRADVTVTGAGSTWSQIAVDQWRADVASQSGLRINFSGVGSSAGRQFYLISQVDFAVSEIPFQPDEVAKLRASNRSWQYLPIVAGGTALMYNLKDASGRQIRDLRLSASTIAGIFTGRITNWSDAAITADYGRALPAKAIIPVVRSDGSGTSAQFSAYLARTSGSDWSRFASSQGIPNAATSNYPQFGSAVASKGSDGVANYVAAGINGVGSIGYVETGFAVQRGFPVVAVKNASGNFALPSAANVAIALTKATLNSDNTQNLEGVYANTNKASYPISSYSYMITPTTGLNPDKGAVLGKFMLYFACAGQQKASVLGYSPLPPNLIKVVFDAVKKLPGEHLRSQPSVRRPARTRRCPGPSAKAHRLRQRVPRPRQPAAAARAMQPQLRAQLVARRLPRQRPVVPLRMRPGVSLGQRSVRGNAGDLVERQRWRGQWTLARRPVHRAAGNNPGGRGPRRAIRPRQIREVNGLDEQPAADVVVRGTDSWWNSEHRRAHVADVPVQCIGTGQLSLHRDKRCARITLIRKENSPALRCPRLSVPSTKL